MTKNVTGFKDMLHKIREVKEFTPLVILLVIFVLSSILSPVFLTSANLRTTAIGFSTNGIVAIAVAICLISGGFDLSVGSVLGLSSIICVLLINGGVNVWLASLIALVISMLCGLVNGYLIGYIGLNGFIMTLGMQQMARGLVFVLTNGGSVGLNDAPGLDVFRFFGAGNIGNFPVIVVVFIVCVAVSDILVRRAGFARNLFFVGSNAKTAMLSGINTKKIQMLVYTLSGLISGAAGILSTGRFGMATSSTGNGIEMTILSGAVIGGVSLTGGKGTVLGAVLGVIMMSLISNVLVIMNVSVHWQSFITGAILIFAILFDALSNRKKD
jgi:ribose transport system permease protein